jgi:hypothetical protein
MAMDPREHMRCAVLGDDNLLVVSGALWTKMGSSTAGLVKHIEDAGMKPETKFYELKDACKAEFCSGWFAAHDINGEIKCVWTPKVGRVLMKTLMIKPLEPQPMAVAKGICIGLTIGPTCPLLRTALKTLQGTISGQPQQMANFDWNPRGERVIGKVKPIYRALALRYDLTEDQIMEVENYLAIKMKGEFPINLDPNECPPLRTVVELDVGFSNSDVITLNLNQVNPNLSTVNRERIQVPQRFQRQSVAKPLPSPGQ